MMDSFSGASTPRFDTTFDLNFGTPQDLFTLNEKQDYFSNTNKIQADFGFPELFSNSPYPNQSDITPPQTAIDPPTNWPYGLEAPEQLIGDTTFNQQHPASQEIKTLTSKIQYGHTTPPDEVMRDPDLDSLKNGFSSNSSPSCNIKRDSTTLINYIKPTKRSKKNKSADSNEEVDKRSKFLERNRVAASKCRQKKKEYNCQLEQKAKFYERDNALLKMQLEKYQTEKINLMTAMALHTPNECSCHQIHQHLASFKAQFSQPVPLSERNHSVVSTTSTTEATKSSNRSDRNV